MQATPIVPTIQLILGSNKLKNLLQDVKASSPEKPRGWTENGNPTVIITVQVWLGIVAEYPEAVYMDMALLKQKFEDADFLDCPVSLLYTVKDCLGPDFHMTIKERAFVIRALEVYQGAIRRHTYEACDS